MAVRERIAEIEGIEIPIASSVLFERAGKHQVAIFRREECGRARGCAVVIDVLRAFTTAAYALANGAERIILMDDIQHAMQLKKHIAGSLLMGEDKGMPIPGFDFDNSPLTLQFVDVAGRTLIQRTSAGTQAALSCNHCETMLVASFVVAEATLQRLERIGQKEISFVASGTLDGSEDVALAQYLIERLRHGEEVDPTPFMRAVRHSPAGHRALEEAAKNVELPINDLDASLAIDAFPFAMEAKKEQGIMIVQAVDSYGRLWQR